MKQVGVKIEGRMPYGYYLTRQGAEDRIRELTETLKEGQAVEVKCGREHHWIDYDEDCNGDYDSEVERVMYYVKRYLE